MYQNMLAVMEQKGLTIDAISKVLHVHRNTVSNKLTGKSEFTFAEACVLCDTLFPEYKPSFIFHRTNAAEQRR